MKTRTKSKAGNPIRRPPNSGESSGMESSSGYASSSGYSSSASSVGNADGIIDRMDRDVNDNDGPNNDNNNNTNSRIGAGGGPYSPTRSSSFATSNMDEVRIARIFFALACLWPVLFLLIPPSSSPSHVALLSTGMDTMDSHSLSEHIRQLEKQTHDKIDRLRSEVSGNVAAKTSFLRSEMQSLLHRTDVVGYGNPYKPRIAVVVVVPPVPQADMDHREHADQTYEEQAMLDGALAAVESVFRTTDRNRIFVVTVVMDGRGKIGEFESRLQDIDAGRTAHRHGDQVHTHNHHRGHYWDVEDPDKYLEDSKKKKKNLKKDKEKKDEEEEGEEHSHSEKIHTIYNHESVGVSASRKDGVEFINVLAKKHDEAGLKSREEELILLFLRCDAKIREFEGGKSKRTWLDDVTDALILGASSEEESGIGITPAGVMSGNNDAQSKTKANQESKREQQQQSPPANAVSFVVDFSSTDREGNIEIHQSHVGDTMTFDQSLHPIPAKATAQQMSMSNGESYPAPLTSVATALRLNTYNAFPAHDEQLINHYAADLELSFNLWMCADGIDILGGGSFAHVVVNPLTLSPYEKMQLPGPLAARIVSAWMSGHDDENFSEGILHEVAAASATTYISKKIIGHHVNMKDHLMTEQRELMDKVEELRHTLVRIASEAKQSSSFPSGLAKKCRPFSWYAQIVHPEMEFHEGEGGGNSLVAQNENMMINNQQVAKIEEQVLPSQPLDQGRMAIVAQASPVKLTYVDASDGHRAHPHKGATDEQGKFGYVHDETALRRNPPAFEVKENEHAKMCKKGDPNWKMLTEKVYVDLTNHEAAEKRAEHGLAQKKRAKIFCLVYTIEKNHGRIPAIRETWGQKCDGFMVASTKTDKELGTVNIPHEGPEEYNNIWQKVRAMWSYIYDNYYEKYDYFHIGGDDLYLIVENLRLYLESEEIQVASNGGHYLPTGLEKIQTPLFLGRRFAEGGKRDRMFISGGSGYTMNKAALKILVVDGFPQCFPHMKTFSEDVMVATCLRKMDILPYDTKDEAGGERYMPFEPGHHLTYYPPKNPKDDWYSNYSVDCKWGIDHCAAKSVAFHYIKEDLMKRMHAILYHHC